MLGLKLALMERPHYREVFCDPLEGKLARAFTLFELDQMLPFPFRFEDEKIKG